MYPTDGDLEVQPIPPLGSVDFEMRDRSLPPIINVVVRVDSSLKSYSLDQDYLDEIAGEALEQSKQGRVSLSCYLRLRKQILEHCASKGASEAVVVFTGEDRGDTEVVVRSRKPTDPALVTGLLFPSLSRKQLDFRLRTRRGGRLRMGHSPLSPCKLSCQVDGENVDPFQVVAAPYRERW